MNQQATASQKSRAEQETENEANRLREQVDAALAAVVSRSPDEVESLQTAADRIERAARDLSDALRQLAQQRKVPGNLVTDRCLDLHRSIELLCL